MPRGNPSKLQPIQTKQEASERGRNGGIKSGQARRRKKSMKELMTLICSLPLNDPKIERLAENLGVDLKDLTYGFMVNFGQVQKAIKEKDTRAAEYVRDTLGERPTNQVQVSNTEVEDLTPLATMLKVDEETEVTEDEKN